MDYLRKYATATHVYIPIIKRAAVDFAVSADWTPATGDVKVSIDGGTAANIGTLPAAITMGNAAVWDFVFTTGELTGKKISVTVADSATKAVEDQSFSIATYGHASAEYVYDFSVRGAWDDQITDHTVSGTFGDKIGANLKGLLKVIIGSGSTSTDVKLDGSVGVDGGVPSGTNDFYNTRVLILTSGSLAGEITDVTDYDGATTTMTVTALTGAPANGDLGILT